MTNPIFSFLNQSIMIVAVGNIHYSDTSKKVINITSQMMKGLTTPLKDGRSGWPSKTTLKENKISNKDWITLCRVNKEKALLIQLKDMAEGNEVSLEMV